MISPEAEEIFEILRDCGACAVGTAVAGPVDRSVAYRFDSWLASGHNAGMAYMSNWREIRMDPRLLLEEARSVICTAFAYPSSSGPIASYALGEDYHVILRKVLDEAVERMRGRYGGEYRICVDSAPILERYWAEKCGVGYRGCNGLIIVPGIGSRVFLAEIVTTLSLPATAPLEDSCCADCRGCQERCQKRCQRYCPAGALQADGTVDARRCLSYLTIEHRGEWDDTGAEAMATPAGRATLYGCDICQRVCPHNSDTEASMRDVEIRDVEIRPEFSPREEIASLTKERISEMTQEEFSRLFRNSPIKRTKLAGLRRNALNSTHDD